MRKRQQEDERKEREKDASLTISLSVKNEKLSCNQKYCSYFFTKEAARYDCGLFHVSLQLHVWLGQS